MATDERPSRRKARKPAPAAAAPFQALVDLQRLFQDLQLRQVELEMQNLQLEDQNEELRHTQEELKLVWRKVDGLVVERTSELTAAVTRLSEEVRLRFQMENTLRGALAEAEAAKERLKADLAQLRRDLEGKG